MRQIICTMFQFDTYNNQHIHKCKLQHYTLIIYHLNTQEKFYHKNRYANSTNSKVQ